MASSWVLLKEFDKNDIYGHICLLNVLKYSMFIWWMLLKLVRKVRYLQSYEWWWKCLLRWRREWYWWFCSGWGWCRCCRETDGWQVRSELTIGRCDQNLLKSFRLYFILIFYFYFLFLFWLLSDGRQMWPKFTISEKSTVCKIIMKWT